MAPAGGKLSIGPYAPSEFHVQGRALQGAFFYANAGYLVPFLHFPQFRHLVFARFDDRRTAGVKHAPGGRVLGTGNVPLKHDVLPLGLYLRVGHGYSGKQSIRVGVQSVLEQLVVGGDLHDLSQIHDSDAIRDVANHRQVVGDEQVGQIELRLKVLEQVDDLGLNGYVQGGDGLVGDDKLRLCRQRSGDADALPLPSAELMGIAVSHIGIQTHRLQQVLHPLLVLLAPTCQLVDRNRLPHDAACRHAWIQRGVWILKDGLGLTAHRTQTLAIHGVEVHTVIPNTAGCRFVKL